MIIKRLRVVRLVEKVMRKEKKKGETQKDQAQKMPEACGGSTSTPSNREILLRRFKRNMLGNNGMLGEQIIGAKEGLGEK